MIRLQLHLVVDGDWAPVEAALARHEAPKASSSTLSFEVDGVEHLLGMWNLGPVDVLGAQLDACAARVASGRLGVVRSGVRGLPDVPWHVVEVDRDATALVSRCFVDDPAVRAWGPLPGWGVDDPEELYAWLEAHLDELLADDAPQPGGRPPMRRVRVDAAELVAQLRATAAACRAVAARAESG